MIPIPDDEDEKLQEALEVSTCEVEFQRGGRGGGLYDHSGESGGGEVARGKGLHTLMS
jgi:hypothetical protein